LPETSLLQFVFLIAAALAGGLANALAGGGTFLVFPALILTGVDPVAANATAAGCFLPGAAASAWVYSKDSPYAARLVRWLLLVSVLGGISGSVLLLLTPSARFARLVPYLMLSAALVFTFSERIQRLASARPAGHTLWTPLLVFQYLISVYGGYFGAGMGVLMIVLFLMTANLDVQRSAALRFYCGLGINTLAVAVFAWRGLILWKLSVPMAAAAVAGGYWGAHAVRRMSRTAARRAVLVYAWIVTLWLFARDAPLQ
jgi:uncharacterized membrane protein YfcA